MNQSFELSVVIPCLNEEDTIGVCVEKAVRAMREASISGEVIVADNGSEDRSKSIATDAGARIVDVPIRGYGSALMHGIRASHGKFVLMGDADDSYDFLEIPKFIERLREGFDLVQGCRFPRGGGTIYPGAMPFLHRWFGNPLLSWLVRRMFRIPINDVYCGMRGFTREHYDQLDLRSPGMEFATEMIIKSGLHHSNMSQVPISLHPDGRKQHGPHLRTFRDGWRTLRLFLVFSPKWSFFYPGLFLVAIACLGYLLAIPQVRVFGAALDVHTLLIASLMGLLGWQCILMSALARIFAGRAAMMPPHRRLENLTVESGLVFGVIMATLGISLVGKIIYQWSLNHFGPLNYPETMRFVVPGVTLVAIGFQTVIASIMGGVLKMQREASS